MESVLRRLIIISCLSLACLLTKAQEPEVKLSIDSTTVTAHKRTAAINGNLARGLKMDISIMDAFPKVLGNSDPMRYVQSLPGIVTNSENSAGLRIQGCENSHNDILLDGVPLYGFNHIMGLFSIFNPTHYDKMTFSTQSGLSKLAGELKMDSADTVSHSFKGDITLGMLTGQGTLKIPTGKKASLTVSARRSFLDIFYKNLFEMDGNTLLYYFNDYNLSWIWTPTDRDIIDISAYYGKDLGSALTEISNAGMKGDWGNYMGTVRWRHSGAKVKAVRQFYTTGSWSDTGANMETYAFNLNSDLNSFGYKSDLNFGRWAIHGDLSYYDIQPQYPVAEGQFQLTSARVPRQRSALAFATVSRSFEAGYRWTFKPTVLGAIYKEFGYDPTYWDLSPSMKIGFNMFHNGLLNLEFGIKKQYLFQTGISNSGFPIEYWVACGRYCDPQRADFVNLSYDVEFARGMYSLTAQTYFKRLTNQVEYSGLVTDVLTGSTSLEDNLFHGYGMNFGASLMLQKRSGRVTGWISYAWGRALRRFDSEELPGTYPSAYERLHELDAVAMYKLGRWEFGANFVFASGVPYTPATGFYVIGEQILVQYGERNSKRLSPYMKLDLSATFNIRRGKKFQDSINLSLMNATAHKNQLMASLNVTREEYSFKPTYLIIPILPSLSYQCKF